MEQKRNGNALSGCLVVFVILAVIAVLVIVSFGLRGCADSRTASSSTTAGTATTAGASEAPFSYSDFAIENKTYAALHVLTLSNNRPLDTLVHVVEIAYDPGLVITVRLNQPKSELQGAWGAPVTQRVVTKWATAVMTAVPDATRVIVVDSDDSLVGSVTRQ